MISTCGAPREPSFTLIVFSMTVSIIPALALSVVSQKADPKIRKTTCPPPEPFAARTNYQDSAALRRVEIERVLQRATEAAQQGRLREALEVLNSVSSSADLLPAYFHLRGTLEARTNQLELAEKDLRKALILAPRLSDAMYTLGLIELQQDKPGEAREWLSKSVDLNGQRPESWLALGQAYLHLKNAGLAENSFQAAIRLGHGAAPIYLGVGTAYQGQG